MNYKDQWAENENGERFLFTVEMQRALAKKGLPVNPSSLSQLKGQKSSRGSAPASKPSPQPSRSNRQDDFEMPDTIQIDPETGKYIGRMKWFNASRGYGFILRGGGEDIFFHKAESLVDPESIQEGQWVLYDVEETDRGIEATDVELYNGVLPI
jgi:CspA family cold shock protein